MQKHVNIVDLVKSFPTNIFLQDLASIQKRTSSIKFDHLAEKSEHCSVWNLPTKLAAALPQQQVRVRQIVDKGDDDGTEDRPEREQQEHEGPERHGKPAQDAGQERPEA